jgi:hypothetical protein
LGWWVVIFDPLKEKEVLRRVSVRREEVKMEEWKRKVKYVRRERIS